MNSPKLIQKSPFDKRSITTNVNDAISTNAEISVSTKMSATSTTEISKPSLKNSRSFGNLNHRKSNNNSNSKKDESGLAIVATAISEEVEDIVTLFESRSASIYKFPVLQPPKDYNSAPELPTYLLEDSEDFKQRRKNLLVAQGKFQIYKMLGKAAAYVRCGQFIHPILPKMRLWRVLVDQFIFPQPNPGKYWRLEISQLAMEDADALENIFYDSCLYQKIYVTSIFSDPESDQKSNASNSGDNVVCEAPAPHSPVNSELDVFRIPLDLIDESPKKSFYEDDVTTSESAVLSSIVNEKNEFLNFSCGSINSDEDQRTINHSLPLHFNFSDDGTDIEQTCDNFEGVTSIPVSDDLSQYGGNDHTLHSSSSILNLEWILEPFRANGATANQNDEAAVSRTSPSCHEIIFKKFHFLQNSTNQFDGSNWSLLSGSPTLKNDISLWSPKLAFKPACQLRPVDQSTVPSVRHRLRTSSNELVRSDPKPASQLRCENTEIIEIVSKEGRSNLPSATFPQRTLPNILSHFLPSFKAEKLKTDGMLDALFPHFTIPPFIAADLIDSYQQRISLNKHTFLAILTDGPNELKSPNSLLQLKTWNSIIFNIWPQNSIGIASPSKRTSD